MDHVPVSVREHGWLQEPATDALTTFLSFSSFSVIWPLAGFFLPLPDFGLKVAETSLIFAEAPPTHLPDHAQRSMSPLAEGAEPAAVDVVDPGVAATVGAAPAAPAIASDAAIPATATRLRFEVDLIKTVDPSVDRDSRADSHAIG